MKLTRSVVLLSALALTIAACEKEQKTVFKKLSADRTGIHFSNEISESDTLNILKVEYIYNGGGVGVSDFNNDGLSDVFLTGNMVPNRLYLNKGNLTFEDISETAGIGGGDKWKSGLAVADVNGDGWKDIYVCATLHHDPKRRENMLFINQGLDATGIPRFKDEAAAYGLNFSGHSSGAAFIDIDNDNDLDLYIMTNVMMRGIPTSYRAKINDGTVNADVLYRNNGNGTFTDISKEAGILHEGYGLGLAIADIDQDGWQDIYVSNDYITNDLLYRNNHDGTFTNVIDERIRHQSQFSMGNDIADFNNDGLPDIVTVDMLPENNLRRKTVIGGASYSTYINNEKYGYAHQYIRNMLQLNNGDGTFSEIGMLAGMHQTEWSWSPLFVDVDNDGWKDLIITNGFPRDITDKDFSNFRAESSSVATIEYQIDSIPVVKIANCAFRNKGDLTFEDMTEQWGMGDLSFSSGAAFADFDNDGDLDYIVNNINDEVLFYENTIYAGNKKSNRHYLRIRLSGDKANPDGLGAKILLHYGNGRKQYQEFGISRGYISSVENIAHFGLDTIGTVDSVIVDWPGGKRSRLTNVKADQVVAISLSEATWRTSAPAPKNPALLMDVTAARSVNFTHDETDKIDFNTQRTLPHKFSQAGPSVAVGDVNGDKLEDFFVGGAANHNGIFFLQQKNGSFVSKELIKSATGKEEDQGALLFDADNDADLDLYVVSGTFEYSSNSKEQQDRLYRNDGKGNFNCDSTALPPTRSSGSCVRAADFDGDGDLDLFVGGRVVPDRYPEAPESYLLINDKGKFTNKTDELSKELQFAGMVTDALWTDVDSDGKIDLMVATEFMPLQLFRNDGHTLQKVKDSGLDQYPGWWNSLAAGDFDSDGDTDFIAGNLGTNNFYHAGPDRPLRVYAKDFDANGSIDAVLSCYIKGEDGKPGEFPVHFWEELNSQSPKFRRKYAYYKQFGKATLPMLLSDEERKDALVLTASHMATSYIENLGGGKFNVKPLPVRSQTAPVNGIIVFDADADGDSDVLMVGNDYGNEVNIGRYDAFQGLLLLNDGGGNFVPVNSSESGFVVNKDAKALARLSTASQDLFIASQNRDALKLFQGNTRVKGTVFTPAPLDVSALITFSDGKKQKVEFPYGSGYLSQSSRTIVIPENVTSVVITNSKGAQREVTASN